MSASQSKPKWRRWLREALQLAVILLLVGAAVDWWRAPQQPLQAADTPLQLVDGRSVSLRALSHEQPLVLYFWGSWCGICRHTSPAIDKLARNAETGSSVFVLLRNAADTRCIHQISTSKLEKKSDLETKLFNYLTKNNHP